MTVDDATLMVAVADGDLEAFEVLYDRFAPRVHGVVRTVLEDPEVAAEVTGAVFVEAWRRARAYDPARLSVGPWLVLLAHRHATDRAHHAPPPQSTDPHDQVIRLVDLARASRRRVPSRARLRDGLIQLGQAH